MLKRFLIAGGAMLAVILIIAGIKGLQVYSQMKKFSGIKQQTFVSDEAARQETWQPNFNSVGNLAPVQGVDLSNQLAGTVSAIDFHSGQEVKQGQLLVQLDDSSERAQLEGFQAQEKLAELNARRAHEIGRAHV